MKKSKIKQVLKNNIKVVVAFIIGVVITGTIGVYSATVISAVNVSFSGSTSGLTSTNMQDALNEAYNNADIRNRGNIVSAYTYNSSTCVTGEEKTCVRTECYKNKTAGSCKAGDIIKYKVNDTDIVTFHVMYDNGNTLTMQSQKNIFSNTPWMSESEYKKQNTDNTKCYATDGACTDEGPMTALVALERATKGWTNVNNQTYTMGTTIFKTNAYTGCSSYNSCTTNTYTLPSRTTKARMITLQEATNLGCTKTDKSCPKWMNNYLHISTSYGGTVNDNSTDLTTGYYNTGYWTMNGYSSQTNFAWHLHYTGSLNTTGPGGDFTGVRAVVVVSK